MKLYCDNCKYFTSIGASMENPYPEIYCSKHFIDFAIPPEIDLDDEYMKICNDFEMNRYCIERIKKQRINKLKKILK